MKKIIIAALLFSLSLTGAEQILISGRKSPFVIVHHGAGSRHSVLFLQKMLKYATGVELPVHRNGPFYMVAAERCRRCQRV